MSTTRKPNEFWWKARHILFDPETRQPVDSIDLGLLSWRELCSARREYGKDAVKAEPVEKEHTK